MKIVIDCRGQAEIIDLQLLNPSRTDVIVRVPGQVLLDVHENGADVQEGCATQISEEDYEN